MSLWWRIEWGHMWRIRHEARRRRIIMRIGIRILRIGRWSLKRGFLRSFCLQSRGLLSFDFFHFVIFLRDCSNFRQSVIPSWWRDIISNFFRNSSS